MDEETAVLAATIGARVRQTRQVRRWTLDHLAEVAGVSRRMVVTVEQGAANPSVGTLLRLGEALGVGLPALVAPADPEPVRVTRRGEGAALWRGASGGRGVLVAATGSPDVTELWDWTMQPDEAHAGAPHSPGTRELLQVRDGDLVVTAGRRTVTLAAGDAVAFPGDITHTYANPHPRPARFSLAVFEPGVGPLSRTVTVDD